MPSKQLNWSEVHVHIRIQTSDRDMKCRQKVEKLNGSPLYSNDRNTLYLYLAKVPNSNSHESSLEWLKAIFSK